MEKNRSNYIRHAQGCLGEMSYELRIQYSAQPREQSWTPAINAYHCPGQIALCVELAGVDKDQIQLDAGPRRLLIRGVRPPFEMTALECTPLGVFALEIDHGIFQRELTLPMEIDPAKIRAEQRNGLLWIYLPLA